MAKKNNQLVNNQSSKVIKLTVPLNNIKINTSTIPSGSRKVIQIAPTTVLTTDKDDNTVKWSYNCDTARDLCPP